MDSTTVVRVQVSRTLILHVALVGHPTKKLTIKRAPGMDNSLIQEQHYTINPFLIAVGERNLRAFQTGFYGP